MKPDLKVMRNILLGITVLFLMSLTFDESRAQKSESSEPGFGFSLSPSIVRLSGAPGESQNATVRVWNKSSSPMHFLAEVDDIGNQVESDGRLARIFPPPGTLPHSCAKWILLPETDFTLPPGEFKEVTLLVSSPSDENGSKAAVVFFRGASEEPAKANPAADKPVTSLQIQPRLGVLVFFDLTGTVLRTGKIGEFSVHPPGADTPFKLSYVFENSGNADILVTGTFYILDQNKALAVKENLNAIRTFPGDRGIGETTWQGTLSPGTYHLVASFELGPDTQEVIVREADFTVS